MNLQELKNITQALTAGYKGLLAMDESTGTCNKRFAPLVFHKQKYLAGTGGS